MRPGAPAFGDCPACLAPARLTSLRIGLPGGAQVQLLRCSRCATEFWSRADQGSDGNSEYWEDYKFDLYSNPEVQHSYEERYRRLLELLQRLGRRPISVLDIGGGIGNFAAWASAQGLASFMTDVDASAVASARQRGVEAVEPKDLGSILPPQGVDAVTLWDVVEHSADPGSLVGHALEAIAPGGTLFIETPDARFPLRKVLLGLNSASGGRFDRTGGLYYFEHKVYFTARGLELLLARLGARIVHVERWTSPRAKMTQLLGTSKGLGTSALYRGIGRLYPYADTGLEQMGLGNKLIVVATK